MADRQPPLEMAAFQVLSHDTPPRMVRMPAPGAPGPGQVLLDIHACGLNFADLLLAEGRYQEKPALPFVLGMEPAGVVRAVGEGVRALAPGDRAMCFAGHGGLAGQGLFDARACTPIPSEMSFADAAAFQVAYGTAHVALAHRARLTRGETLVVLGAAGGVGLAAVEVGRLMGARVVAVARGRARLEAYARAGAEHLIDPEGEDLRECLRALGGADVVFDPVGGEAFRAALRACRPEARMIVVGFASGEVERIPANILLVKNLTVIGYYWGAYLRFRPEVLRESMARLVEWYRAGRLRPHVGRTLPLERAGEAYEMMRARRSTGKLVVKLR